MTQPWMYDAEEYARTRSVSVGGCTADGEEAVPDADGFYRWVRTRTGEEARIVTQSVSQGFTQDRLKWCYRNAVKENYPLEVPVPLGVEPLEVIDLEDLLSEPAEDPDEQPAEGAVPAEGEA